MAPRPTRPLEAPPGSTTGRSKTALVLLPGLAGHREEFAAQVRRFGPARRVLVLAPFQDGALSLAARADRVLDAAAAAGLESYVVLGHSTSGMVALELATRRPGPLRGVVLLDSAVLLPSAVRLLARLPLLLLCSPLGRPLLQAFFSATFTAADPQPFRAAVRARLRDTPTRAARALTHTNFTYDSTSALGRLGLPALVARANIPVDLDRLPAHVQRVDIPDVGHWPHVHAPDSVNDALDEFLRQVDAVAAPSAAEAAPRTA